MRRRDLLAAAPAAGLLAALPAPPAAAAGHAGAALPGAQRFRVGDRAVTALLDGAFPIDRALLANVDAEGYEAAMRAGYHDPAGYLTAVNAFAVDGPDGVALIDAGSGQAMGPDFGRIPANLEAAGIAAEDVTTLVATHLHPDHVGGAILEDGSARFPDAELVVHAADRDFWTDTAIRDGAPEEFRPFFDLASAVVEAYGDRLRIVEGEEEVAPGLATMPLPGHTPGHMGVMLDGGGEAGLLLWGDIVHVPPVQLAMPEVTITFDTDQARAAETRAALLDRVAADRLMIAGAHMTFPGLAHIEAAGEGYRAVPAAYDYG
jgi:glyoxylase-like metal-dependent hydrolase (beta-lactamase superfamily II)